MPIKAIIFDRDGVLTYFDLKTALAFFQPLVPLTVEEIADKWRRRGKAIGFPRNLMEEINFFRDFWDAISDELRLASEVRQQLQQFEYTGCIQPFGDARPALIELRQRALPIGVLSNFSLASLEVSLAAVNLSDLIDVACAATVIGAAKPAAEAYQTVSRLLQVEPDECLFFDDEIDCVEGARAVGMHAYLVDRQRTEHALAEGVVCDLTAVSQILA
ncbi:MAG: HAD-IA family hydrolase [Chloroflexi bacterium]|nr:HAD-IA family hydrolase [Chloroflexota bacterium]